MFLDSRDARDARPEGRRVRSAFRFLFLCACAVFLAAALAPRGGAETGKGAASPVERGKYLVTILGCGDCHTPLKMGPNGPEPDMSKFLSGHPADVKLGAAKAPEMPWMFAGSATMTAFVGPWGVSYAVNLTPDDETGIGAWDEDLFLKIFRSGKFMGAGRPIMPPMPIEAYSHMTDDDLKAVYAYLRSIPPVKNEVPDYAPPSGGEGRPGQPH
jgi:mono/diheme cytochrome c family protein